MYRKTLLRMTIVILGSMASAQAVFAQIGGEPRSDIGGFTGEALRRLYARDIGRGYTAESAARQLTRSDRANVPFVGQTSAFSRANRVDLGMRLDLGLGSARTEKPFSNVSSRPTVSPYLNLFREDFDGSSDFNYQTLVRPQLQQQELNQRFQDQAQAISRRVQQISARTAYDPRGSQSQYPTGHQTVFGYYGRFYPSMSTRGR